MTTAEQVVKIAQDSAACTFYGGYAIHYNGQRTLFEPAHVVLEKRNQAGRVVRGVYQFKDGSQITFRWSENGVSFTCKGKAK